MPSIKNITKFLSTQESATQTLNFLKFFNDYNAAFVTVIIVWAVVVVVLYNTNKSDQVKRDINFNNGMLIKVVIFIIFFSVLAGVYVFIEPIKKDLIENIGEFTKSAIKKL